MADKREVVHKSVRLKGLVQGVFFRTSARDKASEMGLAGWIRNEEDGSVYIEVEGGERSVERFLDWCRRGSELTKVEDIKVQEGAVQGLVGFVIKLA